MKIQTPKDNPILPITMSHLKSICLTSLLAGTTLTWRLVISRCSSSWLGREEGYSREEPED